MMGIITMLIILVLIALCPLRSFSGPRLVRNRASRTAQCTGNRIDQHEYG